MWFYVGVSMHTCVLCVPIFVLFVSLLIHLTTLESSIPANDTGNGGRVNAAGIYVVW